MDWSSTGSAKRHHNRRLGLEPAHVNLEVRLVSCCPSRRRANCSGVPNVSSTPQYITLIDDHQMLAEATIRSATHRPSIHADLHVEAGHLPVGTRTRLVDAVLDLTAAEPGTHLQVTLPAGDAEILDRLRERCDDLQTRSAGASCLATGTIRQEATGRIDP
jgi:hypothetical protein